MKQYDIVITEGRHIDFSPETENAEIIQNIRTIILTSKFSVPLFREFGIEYPLDSPYNEASAKLKSDILMAIRKYEPRANISRIAFDGTDINGHMRLKLTVML